MSDMSVRDNSQGNKSSPDAPDRLEQTDTFDRRDRNTECISVGHKFSTSPSIPPGEVLGDYKIIERIGAGGMGVVYKALNMPLDRTVALKILPWTLKGGDPIYRERFSREAKAAAKVRHPNVVIVFRTGRIGEHSFIESEFVEGQNLRILIEQEGRLPPDDAVLILRDAAEGLAAVHQNGLVHRDVKPGNILIDADGKAKIADFGLVRAEGDDSSLTVLGGVLGSPYYMSPEQCEGKTVDLRSDIYSLGVTFYHMLTGAPPFCAGTALAILRQHIDQEIPSASTIVTGLPDWACTILERMLAKKPEDRYENCQQLLNDLPVGEQNGPPPMPEPALQPEPARRNKTKLFAALLFASLLLTAAVIKLVRRPTPPPPGTTGRSSCCCPPTAGRYGRPAAPSDGPVRRHGVHPRG